MRFIGFAATCSQFLLNGVIKVLVEKYKETDPELVVKMLHSFYVDDLITGTQSTVKSFIRRRRTTRVYVVLLTTTVEKKFVTNKF